MGAGNNKWCKNLFKCFKQTYTGTIQDLKELFHKKLEALAIHQFNWIHQTEQFHDLKQNLTESEAVLHLDFFENYACKMSTEIQFYHFGGSRKQATIHSAVKQDKRITVLHEISDERVTQYRNKSNFYPPSTVPFLSGFKHVT